MDEHCKVLREKFSAYIDGEACDEDCKAIAEHIETCECCKSCMESLKATRDMLEKMPWPQIPEHLKDRLKSCLKND